jgi:hypothetical protein
MLANRMELENTVKMMTPTPASVMADCITKPNHAPTV